MRQRSSVSTPAVSAVPWNPKYCRLHYRYDANAPIGAWIAYEDAVLPLVSLESLEKRLSGQEKKTVSPVYKVNAQVAARGTQDGTAAA